MTEPDRNVTPSTTDSSRIADIHARLDAWREVRYPQPSTAVLVDDVAWLLDEVERLTARVRIYEEVKS